MVGLNRIREFRSMPKIVCQVRSPAPATINRHTPNTPIAYPAGIAAMPRRPAIRLCRTSQQIQAAVARNPEYRGGVPLGEERFQFRHVLCAHTSVSRPPSNQVLNAMVSRLPAYPARGGSSGLAKHGASVAPGMVAWHGDDP